MTIFETNRIETDEYGAIVHIDNVQTKMVVGFYLLGKTCIEKILFKPNKAGLGLTFNEIQLKNFKLLSSLLHHTFMEYIT